MKFTVDRASWRFGGKSQYSVKNGLTLLLNSKGKMCCLGFCSIQLGYKPEDILGRDTPVEVKDKNEILTKLEDGVWFNSDLSRDAMYINDRCSLTNENREKELQTVFAEYGHEIEFTGEYDVSEDN